MLKTSSKNIETVECTQRCIFVTRPCTPWKKFWINMLFSSFVFSQQKSSRNLTPDPETSVWLVFKNGKNDRIQSTRWGNNREKLSHFVFVFSQNKPREKYFLEFLFLLMLLNMFFFGAQPSMGTTFTKFHLECLFMLHFLWNATLSERYASV